MDVVHTPAGDLRMGLDGALDLQTEIRGVVVHAVVRQVGRP